MNDLEVGSPSHILSQSQLSRNSFNDCAETNSAPGRQIKTVVDSVELYAQQIVPFANALSKFYLKMSALVS